MDELSPMMKQYMQIKSQNEDSILFFRVGDFYEMFFDDAKKASEELDLVLTGKDCGKKDRAPMCGVPYHSCEAYIARLVDKGYKVAICEQTENPATAKGLVKRDIIRVVTPGTVIEDAMLEEGKNNFLASVSLTEDGVGLCFTDASTGECHATVLGADYSVSFVADELARFNPKELLVSEDLDKASAELCAYISEKFTQTVTVRPRESFNAQKTEPLLLKHFGESRLKELSVDTKNPIASAVGAVIDYLYETGKNGNISVNKLDVYSGNQYMRLDMTAIRNLELSETMRTKSKKGSLLWVLDKTKTAMGKRLIRSWLQKPLINITGINLRQNAVEELCSDTVLRGEAMEYLSGIRDVERLMSRVVYGTASARDLNAVADAAHRFPMLKNLLCSVSCKMLKEIYSDIDTLDDIAELCRTFKYDQCSCPFLCHLADRICDDCY
ncbi:MAG: hypothetical protein U0K70_04005 [Acutalibacteraceae bacterium]|nr:hypothetical protein [Acutalibacteraceae bacterium]